MRNIVYLVLIFALSACSKDDPSEFIWEKSLGSGSAFDTEIYADTSFLIVGNSDQKPLFIKTGAGAKPDIRYSPDILGVYTSVISDTSGFYIAGSSEGKLLLARLDSDGMEKWDTLIELPFEIHLATISKYEGETMMAVASDAADSLNSSGYTVLLFNQQGEVLQLNNITPGFKPAVTDLVVLSSGEIFIAITKNSGGDKSKASVARITPEGNIIWETELSNNQNFGAGSLAIINDGSSLYVSGRTELTVSDGVLMNSFAASLTLTGMVSWKRYLESSNSGTDLDFDSSTNLVVLNKNCLALNFIPLPEGESDELMRVLDVCDSYDTSVHGRALSVTADNDFFIAGSKSGKFYYALRSGI